MIDRKLRNIIISTFVLLFFGLVAYTSYWYYCASKIKEYFLQQSFTVPIAKNIVIKSITEGGDVTGFPFKFVVNIKNPELILPTSDILKIINKDLKPGIIKNSTDSISIDGSVIIESSALAKTLSFSIKNDLFLTSQIEGKEYNFLIKNKGEVTLSLNSSSNILKILTIDTFFKKKYSLDIKTKIQDLEIYDFETKKLLVDYDLLALNTKLSVGNKNKIFHGGFSVYLREKFAFNQQNKSIIDKYPYSSLYGYNNVMSIVELGKVENRADFKGTIEGSFYGENYSFKNFNLTGGDLEVKDLYLSDNISKYSSSGNIEFKFDTGKSLYFKMIWDDDSSASKKKHELYYQDIVDGLNNVRGFYSAKSPYIEKDEALKTLYSDLFSIDNKELKKLVPYFYKLGSRKLNLDFVTSYSFKENSNKINLYKLDYSNKDFGVSLSGKLERQLLPKGFLMMKITNYKKLAENITIYLNRISNLINNMKSNKFRMNITNNFKKDLINTLKIFGDKSHGNNSKDISISLESDPKAGTFTIGHMSLNSAIVTFIENLGEYFLQK